MILNHSSEPKFLFIALYYKSKEILTTTMNMSICFLIILFGVASADKPTSRYGEPKPVVTYKPEPAVTYKPEPVVTYKPQAYRPVVFKKIPVIESTTPGNGGKFRNLKAKIAAKKGGKHAAKKGGNHSKLGKLIPFVLGFKAAAITLG